MKTLQYIKAWLMDTIKLYRIIEVEIHLFGITSKTIQR